MGMKVIGWVKCPLCAAQARFGIDREGQGRTARIVCLHCWGQVQLPRDGEHAADLESRARGKPSNTQL